MGQGDVGSPCFKDASIGAALAGGGTWVRAEVDWQVAAWYACLAGMEHEKVVFGGAEERASDAESLVEAQFASRRIAPYSNIYSGRVSTFGWVKEIITLGGILLRSAIMAESKHLAFRIGIEGLNYPGKVLWGVDQIVIGHE